MSTTFRALATTGPKSSFEVIEFDPGPLGNEQVEVDVTHCGVCHSDLSMADNEWGITKYPFVPGHEAAGVVTSVGPNVKRVKVGDRVGIGWYAASCMTCEQCLSGNFNLCPTADQTIVGRHGAFATKVRCHWLWATPIPEVMSSATVGPMFCGGITVFNPIIQCGVLPTDRVGVVGIGGLGHLALQFLNAWGCEVTAFTSSERKREEAIRLGAHRAVVSNDAASLGKVAGSYDFILVTANADLPWDAYIAALKPKGRLHFVGVVPSPVPAMVFPLIAGQKSLSGTPLGSPSTIEKMLDFAGRHQIAPEVETFPMSRVNDAFEHLRSGMARYRIVLENDLGA